MSVMRTSDFERAEMLLETVRLVSEFFKEDVKRTESWFGCRNPNFGGVSPVQLIEIGRLHKVHQFVKNAFEERMYP